MDRIGSKAEAEEFFNKIKSKSLHISRIPEDTKTKFINLANEQFCGDYGMCMKFLMDGLINSDTQELFIRVEDLERDLESVKERLASAESESDDEEGIKTMSGKVIKRK